MITDKEFRNLEERIKKLEEKVFSKRFITKNSNKKSIIDLFSELKQERFFDQPKFVTEIIQKLAEKGNHYAYESLTSPLQRAVRKGILGRLKKDDKWAYVKR